MELQVLHGGQLVKCALIFTVGGDRGVRVSHFPYHVLPPPVVLCPFASRLPPFIVLLCLQVNQEDQKPGFNFQTVPKLNIIVHLLAFVLAGGPLGPDESYYSS